MIEEKKLLLAEDSSPAFTLADVDDDDDAWLGSGEMLPKFKLETI